MERFNFGTFAGDASQRVHSIVSAAESEAAGLLRDAEREAELIRRDAQAEADRIIEDARRKADDLVAERAQLLADVSDGIVERSELLLDRIDAAGHVKRQFDELLKGIGETAEGVARQAGRRPMARTAPRAPAAPQPRQPTVRMRAEPQAARPAPAPQTPDDGGPRIAEPHIAEPRVAQPPPRPRPAPAPAATRRQEDTADARFDGARLVALQMAVAGSTREEVHAELQRAFRLLDPSSILDDVFGGPRRAGAAS
ncbi:MAG TPA: hypothetical protein VD790_06355 [Thermoleophilaceae bacterium]|nr:hypothetical protein [Thermoleophilaceae bacterium]